MAMHGPLLKGAGIKSAMWGRAVNAVADYQQGRTSEDGQTEHSSRFGMQEVIGSVLGQEYVVNCQQVQPQHHEHALHFPDGIQEQQQIFANCRKPPPSTAMLHGYQ